MSAILPFPLHRRSRFVLKQAERLLELGAHAAEANLFRLLQQQRDVLLRKGVDPARVDRECRELEAAIRATAWRLVFTGGGAA